MGEVPLLTLEQAFNGTDHKMVNHVVLLFQFSFKDPVMERIVSPKKTHRCPNPQDLRVWPDLEVGLLLM